MNFIKRKINWLRLSIHEPFSWKVGTWFGVMGMLLGLLMPLVGIIFSFIIFHASLPSPDKIEDYSPPLITKVYSADGVLLKRFAGQKRIWISLQEIPPCLFDALLSTEDKRFYSHWGLDIIRIAKAMYVDIKAMSYVEGASTITQQLARDLFLTKEKVATRKLKEALTSIRLEQKYTKEEILELYLNQSYMGSGAYGVQAAGQEYFAKDAKDLNIEEAAVIIGLIKAPSRYSPRNNIDLAKQRRNTVLDCMARCGTISDKVADSLKQLDVELANRKDEAGKAPYFVEYVRQYLDREYGSQYIYNSGAEIHTTLNWALQDTAEKMFKAHIDKLQRWMENIHHEDDTIYTKLVYDSTTGDSVRVFKQLQGGLIMIEPTTGYIRAMIGGYDFAESKFNRATQALRQVGSAFKPFVYTVAIDNGWSPADKIDDTPLVLKMPDNDMWRPHNYDHTYKGPTTLRDGLKYSRNIVAIKLIQDVTPMQVIRYARRMGISGNIPNVPSIAIGSCEATLIDMVKAYSVFANLGVKVEPIFIKQRIDRYGKVEKNLPDREVVLPKATAYVMVDMLKSVIQGGTGVGALYSGFDFPAGGKTGTTNDYSDAWFLGFSKYYCCGVRIGFDEMIPIGEGQTGSRAALPIWTKAMLAAHKSKEKIDFERPDNIVAARICLESEKLATVRCPDVAEEIFIAGQEPISYCPLSHRPESGQDKLPVAQDRDDEDKDRLPEVKERERDRF